MRMMVFHFGTPSAVTGRRRRRSGVQHLPRCSLMTGHQQHPDSSASATNRPPTGQLCAGVPKWKTIMRIVIPTACGHRDRDHACACQGDGDGTAPLLIRVGYAQAMNFDCSAVFMVRCPA